MHSSLVMILCDIFEMKFTVSFYETKPILSFSYATTLLTTLYTLFSYLPTQISYHILHAFIHNIKITNK